MIFLSSFVIRDSSFAQVGLKIQLVPEVTAIAPGASFRVGLYIQHDKGWHTYWRQPGIVGVPTSITWTLPTGFKAGPLEYPEPESTKMFQIMAQGYERDVLLQTEIVAPATLKVGGKVTLKGRASWMCCGNTCHPDTMELTLEMPVNAKSKPAKQWHPIFEKERAAYAHPSSAWTATAEEKGLIVRLTLKPETNSARPFQANQPAPKVTFFTEDGWINSDQPQTISLNSDGILTLKLTRAEVFLGKGTPELLHGIVQREGGWHADGSLRSMIIKPVLRR
ncbi:MAG: protein-disulfide reductase DsbD domain-containing protein [Prosthecobacter sp.]